MELLEVATRNLAQTFFLSSEGNLVARGTLTDDRRIPFRAFAGDPRQPGVFHNLGAELTLSLPELEILDIRLSFDTYPDKECSQIEEAYRALLGIRVASGYTKELLKRVGGVKGCSHLTHLLILMGPGIVQGAFTAMAGIAADGSPLVEGCIGQKEMEGYFYNSCHVWKKEEGP